MFYMELKVKPEKKLGKKHEKYNSCRNPVSIAQNTMEYVTYVRNGTLQRIQMKGNTAVNVCASQP